jgi:hypothetical protein
VKPTAPEYLPPSERAALLSLPALRDADLAALLGVSADTLRRSLDPDKRDGALELWRVRVSYLATGTRLWNTGDVRVLLATGGVPFCTSRTSRAASAVAG